MNKANRVINEPGTAQDRIHRLSMTAGNAEESSNNEWTVDGLALLQVDGQTCNGLRKETVTDPQKDYALVETLEYAIK